MVGLVAVALVGCIARPIADASPPLIVGFRGYSVALPSPASVQTLLAARSELGYVEDRSRALRGEPEAVPERVQERLTVEARARAQEGELALWRDCSRLVRGVLADANLGPRFASDLRVIYRQLERIERALERRA